MSIKVILLDIDGTLTNSKKEITPKTKEALLKVQDSGVKLVLASGRTDKGLQRYEQELKMREHHGVLVCNNGATVIDCTTRETLFSQNLTIEQGKAILQHIQSFEVVPLVAMGDYMHTTDVFKHDIIVDGKVMNVMQYESRNNHYQLCEQKDMVEWCQFEIPKILTFGNPEYLQAHYKEMAEPFDDVNSMFTAPFYYEYTAKGVDKTKAIQNSLGRLGYKKEEMMAFGDAQNDQSMVSYAGIGVAMGNAVESLKEVANEVTLSNEEDGIAHSLYLHFPELFK